MVYSQFYNILGPFELKQLASQLKVSLILAKNLKGGSCLISSIQPIEEAKSGSLTFINTKKYKHYLTSTLASACIIGSDISTANDDVSLLISNNPYHTYSQALNLFYQPKDKHIPYISPGANIGSKAIIGNRCYIGCNAIIEAQANIGDDCVIGAGAYIGPNVQIGANTVIGSGASISYALLAENVIIGPGARVGQSGFGFATHEGKHFSIFHTGIVVIEQGSSIGANTTIDRGSINNTIIGAMCRIDNLVQIAHNVELGKGSIVVAQTGIAGSTKIGQYCVIGGQVGISGHLTIGDHTTIAARSLVIKNLPSKSFVGGSPAMPIKDWHRQSIILKNLINKS